VAKITLDGQTIDAPEGAPLVEIIKQNGVWISNLCYIDGLPPYAGCRTCLVEIEGARGLQLACTAKVQDGMVVRTNTEQVLEARQAVLSIINANHPDRCLTCHRRVKCMPGDICLRDDVVTHRCVTCSKNYRCELQHTNELLHMANYEPWAGEARSFYESETPEADRGNPWLEFDPQMCIICTRCVRACDEIRHTGAITLAGRGFSTRIAFGAGGRVDESNCDFCGACIDVCPTATLMEKPNKWVGRTEEWVGTTCNSCAVGCTISLGLRSGRPVIVRPDRLNPVSHDQICVRGRFHYDALPASAYLQQHMIRRDGELAPAAWEQALDEAARGLADIRQRHGPAAIAFLGSPFLTNEENYLVQKLAREVVGTPHIDFSQGAVNRAVAGAVEAAFGTEALPADMTTVARSKWVLIVADDLESSHNIALLRCKDAVVRNGATLVLVSPLRGEAADFAEPHGGVWLRPRPGGEAAVLAALDQALSGHASTGDVAGVPAERLAAAVAILQQAASRPEDQLSVLYAASPLAGAAAGETAKAVANIAIALRGDQAAASLHILPTEANVNGARDMGVDPKRLPGRGLAPDAGLSFEEMIEAIERGAVRGMLIAGDNPLMFAPDRDRVRAALERLELLVVVDQLMTETAQLAHVLLADTRSYSKDGTYTNAERRLNRLRPAIQRYGEARPALETLAALGRRLSSALGGAGFAYEDAASVMAEIADRIPQYARFRYDAWQLWGKACASDQPSKADRQPVAAQEPAPLGEFVLTSSRTLFTSYEGALIRSPEADKLGREEFVEVHPSDAARLGIQDGAEVVLVNGSGEVALTARASDRVQSGMLYLSSYYRGGAVAALFKPNEPVARVRLAVRQLA